MVKVKRTQEISTRNKTDILWRIYIPVGIFMLAFALRLVQLNQFCVNNPFFWHPILDAQWFEGQARQIVSGDFWGREVFFMGPLYPYLIALIYRIFGANIYILLVIQAIWGSLTCVLIFWIARRLFSRSIALISGLMAAFYEMFIFYDSMIFIASLSVFLTALFIHQLLSFQENPNYRRIFFAGIILGLAVIARPNILLLAPLVLIWFWLERSRLMPAPPPSQGERRKFWSFIFIFLLGIGLTIFPVTLRNYMVGHDLVGVTSSGGINFYIGNNSLANGTYMEPFQLGRTAASIEVESAKRAEAVRGSELKSSEVSNYWFWEGLRFIGAHPGEYLKLLGRKFFLIMNWYEIPVNQNYYFLKQYSTVLRLPLFSYGHICPLALLGMLFGIRNWRRLFPLYAMIIAYVLALLLFFVLAQYRVPMVPIMIIFAGSAVGWLAGHMKAKNWGRLVPAVIILAALVIFCNWKAQQLDFSNDYYNLGIVYNETEKYQEAAEAFQKAIELNPKCAPAYANLGISLIRLGLTQEASEALKEAITIDPGQIAAYNNLSSVYIQSGQFEAAIQVLNKVIELVPDYALAYYNLGIARDRLGVIEGAIQSYQKAIAINPSYIAAYYNLGLDYARQGQLHKAIAEWEKILAIDPANSKARKNIDQAKQMLGL